MEENTTELFSMNYQWDMQGPVDIPMTNDYLFRALLQQNNQVLKALICALLHLDPKQIKEVVLENPIELGKSYDDKDFILDIRALLDGNTIINLEMQVINEHNWQERSLCYLCRSFDNLNRGKAYKTVKPVIQIGLLNFTLFSENPEFYATYYMINEKTHNIYSDKLRLSVVDLTKIELATETDRAYGIHLWAKFFKCMDWSELVMLAKENSDIQAAVGTVYQLSREEKIRQQCEAREDYYRRELDRQQQIQQMVKMRQDVERMRKDVEKSRQDVEKRWQDVEKSRQDVEKSRKDVEKSRQDVEKSRQDVEKSWQAIEKREQENKQKEQELQEQEKSLFEQKQELEKRIQELEEQSTH